MVWESDLQLAFETMIITFTTAPSLRHIDHEREVIIETDLADCVSAGLLSQFHDDGVVHPAAYFSEKHTPAECNYNFYDIALMAIITAIEE